MKPISERITKLPKWAQRRLEAYEQALKAKDEQMEQLRKAHAVLFDYAGWFTIKGPPKECTTPDGTYRLFFLGHTGAHAACVLGPDDVLLCGRK